MRLFSIKAVPGRRRLAAMLFLATAAASVGTLALASSSAQAHPSVVRVAASSTLDSVSPKSVTVTCPNGFNVYGTTSTIFFAEGDVVLDDIRPNASLTSVTVTAYENDAISDNWQVQAGAVCASPDDPNLQRVTVTSATDSVSPKTVTANCPAGTRLYGLGGEITGGVGDVFLDDLTPNSGLTSALVTAYENGADSSNWSVTAYAICATPAATMVRVTNTSAFNSDTNRNAGAICPEGTSIHGAGSELTGAVGNVSLWNNNVVTSFPDPDSRANATENGAYSSNWQLTSYAICSS